MLPLQLTNKRIVKVRKYFVYVPPEYHELAKANLMVKSVKFKVEKANWFVVDTEKDGNWLVMWVSNR